MPRFFVEPSALCGDTAFLTGDNADHARVLRLRPGEEVILCAGDGREHVCAWEGFSEGTARLSVALTRPVTSEPRLRVTVLMAYAKSDKLEHVIQKSVELGAAAIAAFPSERCVSRPDPSTVKKKLPRWQSIALSAAEQSGRGVVPTVSVLPDFDSALSLAASTALPLFFYENEETLHLHHCLAAGIPDSACLVTGPEGGFSPQEVRRAEEAGLRSCSLGKRILRCETAPLCALSALLYAAGEL